MASKEKSTTWHKMNTAPHGQRVLLAFEDGNMAVAAFQRVREDQALYGWMVYQKERNVIVASHPVAWSHLPAPPPGKPTKTNS